MGDDWLTLIIDRTNSTRVGYQKISDYEGKFALFELFGS